MRSRGPTFAGIALGLATTAVYLIGSNRSFGYDAAKLEYTDLVKAGVIDPAKVVRTAMQNAASVAGLMLTTETLIAEKPKKEDKAAGGGHAGHGHDFED